MTADDERGDGTAEGSGGADPEKETLVDPERVRELADRLLRGLGLEVETTAREEGELIQVDVSGADREYLLDRRGEALNAVQYLLNRIVYRGRKGKKIHVDSAGFRRMREEEIEEIARRTAEKVLASGEECVLSPLNPYERRLVHLALRDDEGIETCSLGDGFLKRVAIRPAKKQGSGRGERGTA